MLLVHQVGSVKVGEVVRYTLTYTPSRDRVLPTPSHLHVRVKNTCAIPLRAAWVHGPYALHVSAYPVAFNPHKKIENPEKEGAPEYEPMVKAGGSFTAKLLVPEAIRESGADGLWKTRPKSSNSEPASERGSVTWIIEIASQILFSNSASVDFELLVGRDERGLNLGFTGVAGNGQGRPGQIKEHYSEHERREARRRQHITTEGVYSRAIRLVVEDTEVLWDKPPLPTWDTLEGQKNGPSAGSKTNAGKEEYQSKKEKKRRNVHLVVVTHGLHSNIGADMLFLKESIDATVKQARLDARQRKRQYRHDHAEDSNADSINDSQSGSQTKKESTSTAALSGGQDELDNDADASDDEELTIVRGFTGNAIRTENGIQYLGKRLAKYILRFTYPDQPFLPVKKSLSRKLSDTFSSDADKVKRDGPASHHGSSIHHPRHPTRPEHVPYKFTSISFIGHSLGGLIQTYAIAYIHKHSPTFFTHIEPVNFICMASPMLGLSNENPMYVKFALDFGLVGRTGQDLGLTWRAPNVAKGGWNAVVGGLASLQNKNKEEEKKPDASAKPLLRILPTGPAHQVLRMFRNRTVYSNVINDGIVPLRTSCLLFLDWRGLGKVEKARRENGLIGTMAGWGWAELTGANSSTVQPNVISERGYDDDDQDDLREAGTLKRHISADTVPQPAANETQEDNKRNSFRKSQDDEQGEAAAELTPLKKQRTDKEAHQNGVGLIDTFLGWIRPNVSDQPKPPPGPSKKTTKVFGRAQTISFEDSSDNNDDASEHGTNTTRNPTINPTQHMTPSHALKRPVASRGDTGSSSVSNASTAKTPSLPPRTSIFESAGDLLHPPLPSKQWIADPAVRARTIFHDRIYRPEDIPPVPVKKQTGSRRGSVRQTLSRTTSHDLTTPQNKPSAAPSSSAASTTASSIIDGSTSPSRQPGESGSRSSSNITPPDAAPMKIEEKIARAYHQDLTWRKVLVRLEPDAHNNMIVRRMFANAYGWPVIKHLCDTHFADTEAARTRDEDEDTQERAGSGDANTSDGKHAKKEGEEVRGQTHGAGGKAAPSHARTQSEMREAQDELTDLQASTTSIGNSISRKSSLRSNNPPLSRDGSGVCDDAFLEDSDGEDSDGVDERSLVARILNPNSGRTRPQPGHPFPADDDDATPTATKPLQSPFMEGHRGLSPTTTPTTPSSPSHRRKTSNASSIATVRMNALAAGSPVSPIFDTAAIDEPIVAESLVEEPEEAESLVQDTETLSLRPPSSPGNVADVGMRKTLSHEEDNSGGLSEAGKIALGVMGDGKIDSKK
jgi:hypothetical protein